MQDPMEAAAAIRFVLIDGNKQLAEDLLQAAPEDQPWLDGARYMLNLAKGEMVAARKYASKAINGGVEPVVIFDFAAELMEQMDRFDEALRLYCSQLYRDPTESRLLKVALLMLRTGRVEEADKLLNAIQDSLGSWDAAPLQVVSACLKGDRDAVEEKAALLDPKDDSVLNRMAQLQASLFLNQDVSEPLDRLKELGAFHTDLWAADSLLNRSCPEEAVQVLDGIVKREGDRLSDAARMELARRYFWANENKMTREQLDKVDATRLPPRRKQLLRLEAADCMRRMGEMAQAVQIYDELLAQSAEVLMQNPTETEQYLLRLRCYIGKGQKQKAMELAAFVKSISKDDITRQLIDQLLK
ncbi:MAG: hypothetical protein IKK75_09760 [Clostridia bacterium]|nr:hypothetical protein [Clostridia bacterium]